MTTISGTTKTYNANDINYTGAVTPEALMSYCASRIRSLDDQIQEHFERQKQFRGVIEPLNALSEKIGHWGSTSGYNADNDGGKEWEEIHTELANLKKSFPEGSPELARLEAFEKGLNAADDKIVLKEEATQLAQSLGDLSKDISSSAEMDMIKLQSVMSQRQSAVQICTNLISSLAESSKGISQNLRT